MEQDFSAAIDRDRLQFIVDQQAHCDRYLAPIADPQGKEVLVVGAGAGTDILWCLERGAAHVTGVDIKPQPHTALEQALGRAAGNGKYRVLEMGVEDADTLGQKFDLVISNNVFEHLPDVGRALEVCRDVVRPGTGRIAIFSSPLFYSSAGSHLAHLPWEHLWGDPEELREKLLKAGDLPEYHALSWADLPGFFDEIGLNRLRLVDLVDKVQQAGLMILEFGVVKDRHVGQLEEYRARLVPVCEKAGITVTDLTTEGFWIEMAVPGEATGDPFSSQLELEGSCHGGSGSNLALPQAQEKVQELEQLLRGVEKSVSFRLGRWLTAPLRKLKSLF